MKLTVTKSKNSASFYVQKSIRKKSGGTTSITVEKLGNLEEVRAKAGGKDPYVWAQEYVDELNRREYEEQKEIIISYSPAKLIKKGEQKSYNCGYLFLQRIYYSLGLHKICQTISSRHLFEYDLNDILSKLVYTRILYPSSKLAANKQAKIFLEEPSFELHDVYRALSVLSEENDFIQSELYKNSQKVIERRNDILYYDCTNYYFELEEADELEKDPYYFATLLVECGYADGMIGGAEASTATTIKPALQIIKSKNKKDPVSSCFLLYGKNKFLKNEAILLSDCAVLENPDADTLSLIASQSVTSAKNFGLDPKLAFLSYSTHGSAKGDAVNKVSEACEKFKKKNKEIVCDGELQFDAAMVPRVAQIKCEKSELAGEANVLIFPNIEAGNICYKAMQYVGGLTAIGPILQGLKKPVNDLSRGCSVDEIVVLSAITALQCEDKKEKEEKK